MHKHVLQKFSILICMVVMALGLSACSKPNANRDISLHTLNGSVINIQNHPKKWLVINYWASWCKPCHAEIPALNAFYKAHKDKVILLGVSYDHVTNDSLRKLVSKMGIQFPVLQVDPAKLLKLGEIHGLPMTFIINPDGKIVKVLKGAQSEKTFVQAVA